MKKLALLAVAGALVVAGAPLSAHASTSVSTVSTAEYPIGLDFDSSGNLFIASQINGSSGNLGLVVVPKVSGTLFGQAVTAGQETLLVSTSGIRGVAVDSNDDVFYVLSDGKIYALTSSARTAFGVSVSANNPTLIATASSLTGPLEFDAAGNLWGVYPSSSSIGVLPASTTTLFNQSVTANTEATYAMASGSWIWDIAFDGSGNLLYSDGWGNQGVWIYSKSSDTFFGQSIDAFTATEITSFSGVFGRAAGIDSDSAGNVFVVLYGSSIYVFSPAGGTFFGQSVSASTLTQLTATVSKAQQGVAVSSDGKLASGAGSATFLFEGSVRTLSYNANANQHQIGVVTGSAPSSDTEASGTTVAVSTNSGALARQGFTFDGWNTADDGSGTDYDPGDTFSLTTDVTLYAQWGIPQAARLFGQEDDDGNRTETVVAVTGYSESVSQGGFRGMTNDGANLYYLPAVANKSLVLKLDFDGTVLAEKEVANDSSNILRGPGQRDLAYSSDCIFIRSSDFSDLYCIDTSSSDWTLNAVTVPAPGFPDGQGWAIGSILDFPDGKIAVVGENGTVQGYEGDGYQGSSTCPADLYCKVLRVFSVSGSGASVTLTHDQDILLAEADSNWPSDNHGIASDGTYLFQSHHEFGYKTWALQPGVSYLAFNGDGSADVDGVGGTYRASQGHNDNCGATTGVSGGFCPINPEVDDRSGRPTVTRQMENTTFFTRNHSTQQYLMGDYENDLSPRFLITEAATDQPGSDFTQAAPTAPGAVSGSPVNQAVTVSWGASTVSGGGSISYTVTSSPGGLACSTSSTSCQVTGLTNGTSYTFSVVANVASVNSSATVSSTVIPATQSSSNGGSGGGASSPAPVVAPATPAQPRIITPTQPTSRPGVLLGPVSSPGRGFDPNVGTRATVGGAPATVVKRAVPGGFSVQTGAFQFGVSLAENNENAVDDWVSDLGVAGGGTAKVTGSGMLPGSPVQVWLPGRSGTEARELARATVNDEGQVEAELAFVAKPSDTAIAIGPQVMQVTGYDDDGNLTVVDMTINVSQGPITPEPNKAEGALPALSVGSSLATSAGIPTPVTVVPLSQEKRVSIGDGRWTLLIDVDPDTGVVGGTPEAPVVQVTQDSVGSASGEGFMPGTTASVWMFSEPTLLGTVTVGEDGSFTAEFLVDSTYLPVGTHTLQVQGVGEDGYIKAANLGVDVQEPIELTTAGAIGLLWWVVGAALALLVLFFLVFAVRGRSRRSAN